MTYVIALIMRIESEFLETEVEKSAPLIIQVLDYASEDPGTLWDDLVCLTLIV